MYVNTRNLLGHTTGVQRYTRKIIDYISSAGIKVTSIQPDNIIYGIKGHVWEQLSLPQKIASKEVLWSPCNTGPLLIKKQIVTIHDTVPFDHPEWLNKQFVAWYQFMQPRLAKKVEHIITISEFSRERIMHHLRVPESKISVIYNGVDVLQPPADSDVSEKSTPMVDGAYLLSVGSLEPRKNIPRLIKAFLRFRQECNSDIRLVIVGKKGVSRVFADDGAKARADNDAVMFTGHVSDKELVNLYQHAQGFCYPSMYEGFGLPPLEAMCYGLPVLTSNTTSMKELCEQRAILVDPLSVESITEGIYQLVTDQGPAGMREKGKAFAQSLTWKRCASETLRVLEH
ncbi:glycosyltransferase family 4 protein [Dickeya poaceiphila]|uniref:Glycosyltransferase family 4 protein n=1 Tax=Dickeya poaceiphila TaxID=568768 RepID=A0A5B8I8B0_9GAMM|nr:glycosyltransferase family 1 protein [Dickeya poaceiphila]QDX30591.1 glycosyltransferase family 4 protein [Dickeya poaceiphila]